MKKNYYCGLILVFLIVSFSLPVFGQLKIGYINSNRILLEFKEAV